MAHRFTMGSSVNRWPIVKAETVRRVRHLYYSKDCCSAFVRSVGHYEVGVIQCAHLSDLCSFSNYCVTRLKCQILENLLVKDVGTFFRSCVHVQSASQLRKQLLFWIIQSSETNHSAIVNIRVFLRLILASEHLDHRQPFDLIVSHIFSNCLSNIYFFLNIIMNNEIMVI